MSDDGVALARRLFMHVKDGGTVTAMDLSRLVSEMEKIQHERGMAWAERDRLAADLSEANNAILTWIEKSLHLTAMNMEQSLALRRIGMPGKDIGYCRDGHEIAALIARDALKDGER